MTSDLQLRAKFLCGKYWHRLVPALLLVGVLAVGIATASAASEPEPQQVAVETDSMTVETTLSTEATVTGNTSLYNRSETLTDMPVYLRTATPAVELIAVTSTPTDRTVSVTQQIVLELSATRNGEVFWRDAQTLAIDSQEVTDGSVRTAVTLDVQELAREQLADVTAEAGDIGTIEAQVSAIALYDTGDYRGQTTAVTPLSITDRAYELQTPQQDRRTNATTVQQAVAGGGAASSFFGPRGRLTPRDLGVGLGGLGAIGLAAGIWLTSRRIGDFDAFRRQYERVRYVEWISRGTIPATGNYARVPVEALVDLVDIAIDSEKRVIHDTAKDIYAVVDGNLMYEYRDGDDGNTDEFGFASFSQPTPSQPFGPETEPLGHDSDQSTE